MATIRYKMGHFAELKGDSPDPLKTGPASREWGLKCSGTENQVNIETAIGCHTFRATGITDYLANGDRLEIAQRMAAYSNTKTAGLYDRRNDDLSVSEVERVGI